MLARNWKHQWLPLCFARSARTIRIVGTVINPIRSNQNLRVFWKPVNLQGRVRENLYRIIMKTILQEKDIIHCSITIWFINLFLCPKPWKFPQQKQQWTRNEKNWRTFRRGTWRKSEVKKRWSMKQERRAQKFILFHWWTYVIWQMLNWRQAPKMQRSGCTPRWYCKRRFWILCSFYRTRIISITNDSGKSHGYHLQTARLRRTSSWRSICSYPGKKMEDAPKLLKIPKSKCPDIWIRLPRHKWPKSWSSMEDPVFPLERNLHGHPLAGLLWERQFEKILLKHGWEKIPNWECLFVHREKGLFLSVYVDDITLAGKKQNLDPMWKVLNKEVDLGRTNIFPWSWKLGVYSKTMWNKQRCCGQLQSHVWIANFREENWKTCILLEFSYFYVVLWYGRSWQEMCGTIMWVSKQEDSTTPQSIHSMRWWSVDDQHLKEEELKSVGESSKVCSQIVLKCLYLARIGRPDILW